jgi:hypothetical protein
MSTSALVADRAMPKHQLLTSVLDITYAPPRRPEARSIDLSLAAVMRDGSVGLWSRADTLVSIPDEDLERVREIINQAIAGRR